MIKLQGVAEHSLALYLITKVLLYYAIPLQRNGMASARSIFLEKTTTDSRIQPTQFL